MELIKLSLIIRPDNYHSQYKIVFHRKTKWKCSLSQSDVLSQSFGLIFDVTFLLRTFLRTFELFDHAQLVAGGESNLGHRLLGAFELVCWRHRWCLGHRRWSGRRLDNLSLKEFQVGRKFFQVVDGFERRNDRMPRWGRSQSRDDDRQNENVGHFVAIRENAQVSFSLVFVSRHRTLRKRLHTSSKAENWTRLRD